MTNNRTIETKPTIRIVLHGKLRRQFGPEYRLGVTTPAAAIAALSTLKPGFRDAIREGDYRVRRGTMKTGVDLPPRGLVLRLPPGGEMHIIPAAKGAKNGGVGKIIAGSVLMIAAVALMQPEFLGAIGAMSPGEVGLLGAAGIGGDGLVFSMAGWQGSLLLAGGAMALSGIIQTISPQPKPAYIRPSYTMDGMQNVVTQGVCAPLVYGRTRVGSVVASLGYEAVDYVPKTWTPPRPEDYPANLGGSTPWGTYTILTGSSEPVTDGTGDSTTSPTAAGTISSGVKVTGAGGPGKGGPSGGGSVDHNDTLFSKAIVRVIDILGEGPIGGLVNGAQSIFFGETPLMNSDGTYNFLGVSFVVVLGNPEQDAIPGFPASETSTTIGLQVKQPSPIVQRIEATSATAARVTMEIPAAYSEDISTGDISGVDIQYKIEVQASQQALPGWTGAWVEIVDCLLSDGKCESPYQRSHRFDLDRSNGADTWDIRVTRITPDNTDTTHIANDTWWAYLDTIDDYQLMYPNTAYIAYEIDSEAFGGSTLPPRQVEIYGRTIAVPANYNAGTRTYATSGTGTSGGTWDLASYALLPSDNPAFILYDMLINSRYGCGIADAFLSSVLAELYIIAQYADGMIDDGLGSTESRYSVNVVIATQDDAYKVLQLAASAMRAMTYWGSGQVLVSADMPKSISKVINQTNVSSGNFEYQSTSRKTRPNFVRVNYKDASNRYLTAIEPVPDPVDIALRGVVPADIQAWGVTSRGLAHRLGRWVLYTAAMQTETLAYSGGFYHLDTRPGMTVGVADPNYAGARAGGRLRSATIAGGVTSVTTLYLDSVYQQDGSAAYSISVVMPDGTVDANVPITAFADAGATPDYTIVTLGRPLVMVPTANAEWVITSTNLTPREFQILGMGEEQKGVYSITAVNYDPNKFAKVELGLNFTTPVFSALPALIPAALPAPTNIAVTDYVSGIGVTQTIITTVSWTTPTDPRVQGYQVYAQTTGFYQVYTSQVGSCDINGLPAGGSYTFGVRSVAANGAVSAWTSLTSAVLIDGSVIAPNSPEGLSALGGTRNVSITWDAIPNRSDIIQYEVWRSDAAADEPPTGGATLVTAIAATSYLDSNSTVLVPNSTWYYWVRAVAFGTPTVPGDFAGPVSATTTLLIADDLAAGIIGTAAFAAGLAPVSLLTTLSGATGASNTIYFNEADSKLYKWVVSGGTGAFVAIVNATDMAGQLTAAQIAANAITSGQIAAGAITATQIAAGAIHATMLASDFQLTDSAQIGTAVIKSANIANLTVQTSNINTGAVTGNYAAQTWGTGTSNAANPSVTINIPDSSSILYIFPIAEVYVDIGGDGSGGDYWPGASIYVNGSLVYWPFAMTSPVSGIVGTYTGPIVLAAPTTGACTVTLEFSGSWTPGCYAYGQIAVMVAKR